MGALGGSASTLPILIDVGILRRPEKKVQLQQAGQWRTFLPLVNEGGQPRQRSIAPM
jgi:hypothetical protein